MPAVFFSIISKISMEPFSKPGILVTVASKPKFWEGFTKMPGV
jgi:hypothetical protein